MFTTITAAYGNRPASYVTVAGTPGPVGAM